MSRTPDHTENAPQEDTAAPLWQWIAVGLLLVCWIAEASLCADRGF